MGANQYINKALYAHPYRTPNHCLDCWNLWYRERRKEAQRLKENIVRRKKVTYEERRIR